MSRFKKVLVAIYLCIWSEGYICHASSDQKAKVANEIPNHPLVFVFDPTTDNGGWYNPDVTLHEVDLKKKPLCNFTPPFLTSKPSEYSVPSVCYVEGTTGVSVYNFILKASPVRGTKMEVPFNITITSDTYSPVIDIHFEMVDYEGDTTVYRPVIKKITELPGTNHPDFRDQIHTLGLNSKDWQIRTVSADFLRRLDGPNSVSVLREKALNDTDIRVRTLAIKWLKDMKLENHFVSEINEEWPNFILSKFYTDLAWSNPIFGALQWHKFNAEEAVRLDPNNYYARQALGLAYWTNGDVEKAKSTLTSLITDFPEMVSGYRILIYILIDTGDFKNAERFYDLLLKTKPALFEAKPIYDLIQTTQKNFSLVSKDTIFQIPELAPLLTKCSGGDEKACMKASEKMFKNRPYYAKANSALIDKYLIFKSINPDSETTRDLKQELQRLNYKETYYLQGKVDYHGDVGHSASDDQNTEEKEKDSENFGVFEFYYAEFEGCGTNIIHVTNNGDYTVKYLGIRLDEGFVKPRAIESIQYQVPPGTEKFKLEQTWDYPLPGQFWSPPTIRRTCNLSVSAGKRRPVRLIMKQWPHTVPYIREVQATMEFPLKPIPSDLPEIWRSQQSEDWGTRWFGLHILRENINLVDEDTAMKLHEVVEKDIHPYVRDEAERVLAKFDQQTGKKNRRIEAIKNGLAFILMDRAPTDGVHSSQQSRYG